jgi:hypothetical protein
MDDECLENIKVSEIIQFELAFDGIMNISKKNDVDLMQDEPEPEPQHNKKY